jgi:hypothetical protein
MAPCVVVSLVQKDRFIEIALQSFEPPSVPILLQILSGKHTAQELLPKNNLYELEPNKVIEVSIPGGARGAPVSQQVSASVQDTETHSKHSIHSISTVTTSMWFAALETQLTIGKIRSVADLGS